MEETMEFASQYGAECIWTSAFSGLGIDDVFAAIAHHLMDTVKKQKEEKITNQPTVDLQTDENKKKKKCC